MDLLLVLLFGLLVGVAARLLVPGREPGGWITSIVLGILGSFVGAYVGRFLGVSGDGRFAGFLMSVVGAVVLLLGYRLLREDAKRPPDAWRSRHLNRESRASAPRARSLANPARGGAGHRRDCGGLVSGRRQRSAANAAASERRQWFVAELRHPRQLHGSLPRLRERLLDLPRPSSRRRPAHSRPRADVGMAFDLRPRRRVHLVRDLFRRSFHATRVRGSGFAIRLRPRLDRSEATPEVIAALPPIAGFVDPPLLDGGPAPPLLTDENYDLWTVELEDVDVQHVREVWIQTWRSKGDTHLRGRLLFRPQRGLEVGPVTVDANGCRFLLRKTTPCHRATRLGPQRRCIPSTSGRRRASRSSIRFRTTEDCVGERSSPRCCACWRRQRQSISSVARVPSTPASFCTTESSFEGRTSSAKPRTVRSKPRA